MSTLTVNKKLKGLTETSTYFQVTRPNSQGTEKIRQRITARLLPKVSSTTQNRKEKILNIRRQLNSGTYEIKKRLDVATDRLIENLVTEKLEENEFKDKKQFLS